MKIQLFPHTFIHMNLIVIFSSAIQVLCSSPVFSVLALLEVEDYIVSVYYLTQSGDLGVTKK